MNKKTFSHQKVAYLTIDDSPSSSFQEKVAYLENKNIPTVFFCIGQLMEQREEMVIECIQKGFVIANHSYSHPTFSTLSLETCKFEIEKTDQIIDALYQRAGISRGPKWFRFPYGDKGDLKKGKVFSRWKKGNKKRKDHIQKVLQDLGYTQPPFEKVKYRFMDKAKLFEDLDWSWTFDVMEWAIFEKKSTFGLTNIQKITDRLSHKRPKDCRGFLGFEKRWMESTSAEIVLLHDHEETTPHFNTIVDQLLNMPLEFQEV